MPNFKEKIGLWKSDQFGWTLEHKDVLYYLKQVAGKVLSRLKFSVRDKS